MRGLFITLEGPDGCGKTTQVPRIAAALLAAGIPHVLTREPGGSPIGEKIRALLVDRTNTDLAPIAEVLLFMANRNQNIETIVKPGVGRGQIVLSDRHRDSSVAFQGGGRELGLEFVEALNVSACGEMLPDVTIYLDIPIDVSVARARQTVQDANTDGQGDRFEQEQRAFHTRVYDTYQALIRRYPDRFIVIDGTQSIPDVTRAIRAALARRFPTQLGSLA